jgi:hypothetical protein
VNDARLEFESAYLAAANKYKLTNAEILQILNGHVRAWIELALQRERHPADPTKHYSLE